LKEVSIMENLPQIRVSFFFMGDEFNLDDVTKRMNITPTETREKKDFPIVKFAHTSWELDTQKESCKVVSWQFEKLIKLLKGKESIINRICEEYGINAGFVVSVFMENGDGPEMVLTKDIISFLASINAEVGFDLYVD
jgi:hypothetical protein